MNRLAWGFACLAFLVVCSGGLVTAYGAGMAIPDWPTAFGHWFSPPGRWLGPSAEVAVNRTHRTLTLLAGLAAVIVAAAAWRGGGRHAVRGLGAAMMATVAASAGLGGWRVLADNVAAGWLHAVMAPVLLGLCAALVAATSGPWIAVEPPRDHRLAKHFQRACLTALVAVSLLGIGGLPLRHPPPGAGLAWLPRWTWTVTVLALLAATASGWLLALAWRNFGHFPAIVRRCGWFAGLLAAQLLAAGGYWVANYGWPPWFTDSVFPIPYTVAAGGPLGIVATTAYVALGALVPAVGVDLTLWSHRLVRQARG